MVIVHKKISSCQLVFTCSSEI